MEEGVVSTPHQSRGQSLANTNNLFRTIDIYGSWVYNIVRNTMNAPAHSVQVDVGELVKKALAHVGEPQGYTLRERCVLTALDVVCAGEGIYDQGVINQVTQGLYEALRPVGTLRAVTFCGHSGQAQEAAEDEAYRNYHGE